MLIMAFVLKEKQTRVGLSSLQQDGLYVSLLLWHLRLIELVRDFFSIFA